jgi:hypothetical protein
MPAKTKIEQIASRNLGWNIYFSRDLVDASLEHCPFHRQRQNRLKQVTLGLGLYVLSAGEQVEKSRPPGPHLFALDCVKTRWRYLVTARSFDNALTGLGSEIVMRVPHTEQ